MVTPRDSFSPSESIIAMTDPWSSWWVTWVRWESEAKYSHAGDEETRDDEISEVVECPPDMGWLVDIDMIGRTFWSE